MKTTMLFCFAISFLFLSNIYSQEVQTFEGKYKGFTKRVYITLEFERTDNHMIKHITGTEHFADILEQHKEKIMTVEYAMEDVYSPVSNNTKYTPLIKAFIIDGVRYE